MAARSSFFAALAVCLAGATIACAPKSLQLPTTTSVTLDDATPMLREALPQCAALTSVTAELGLSGRVGNAKLRGRIQAGFARPDKVRLEAVAPFGAPFFIVAGTGGSGDDVAAARRAGAA